ncbi:aldose epimerase family protein [Bacteroidota bacterium]
MRRFRLLILAIIFLNCTPTDKTMERITQSDFGKTREGTPVDLYTLRNTNEMEVCITNYGGIITAISVPDRNGKIDDVTLGFNTLEEYLERHPYFGAIVGRFGNRIAGGRFTLDGKEYTLVTNNGPNHLHGGIIGFDKKVWDAEKIISDDHVGIKLFYISPDAEEGYPGDLSVTVTYTLSEENELRIDYHATTDQKTVLNLTNHAYFNLKGEGQGDILDHIMTFNADNYVPTDSFSIPLGNIEPVEGTPFDFRESHKVGERIEADHVQIKNGTGYDHSYVVNGVIGTLRPCATVYEPTSGRLMEVETSQPGVQFYTGNFLNGSLIGKSGKAYHQRSGLCLETQCLPDSPNQPQFPSAELAPGEEFTSTTVYKFTTR